MHDDPSRGQGELDGSIAGVTADATIEVPGVAFAERSENAGRRARRQLIGAIIVAILSTTAAVSSILGQGIAYRQMLATESIAKTLTERCSR